MEVETIRAIAYWTLSNVISLLYRPTEATEVPITPIELQSLIFYATRKGTWTQKYICILIIN